MTNHREQFAEHVDRFIEEADAWEREQRILSTQTLVEGYTMDYGERPRPEQLERLSDCILRDELKDTSAYKINKWEYPFLSRRQFEHRYRRETTILPVNAISIGGILRTGRGRRYRSPYERDYIDRTAIIRNKDRAEQYAKDTAIGEVITYNLRDNGGVLTDEFTSAAGLADRWKNGL